MVKVDNDKNILSVVQHEERIRKILENVSDPEVPVLTIYDLGIVRQVIYDPLKEEVEITITPTYSGCPAMDMISANIRLALFENGYRNIKIVSVLSPAWTTDWMSENGRRKLVEYGIAAPVSKDLSEIYVEDLILPCPRCHSVNTRLISQFGSTACKALFQCNDCKEPFDYFKCH